MNNYKFKFREKEYELNENSCSGLINDEEKPVSNIDLDKVLRLLNQDENIDFDLEYYQEACPECLAGVKEKQKFFGFLEYHFYVFSKDGKYVISDIDKEYEGLSFNKLSRAGKVDDSYIVSIIICEHCGDYIVQIENCIV
ncbi:MULTISPECIES: DUF3785 family protein [Paraclostridium]|uniref:DUF3785 domain-containing protein n=2 Tax=Clostridia TaxID=186801 RepID=A0A0M3DLQ3_9FIRM|nr:MULTISPECIES: DUF3785 family protein [Paraclostridium]KKY02379.1 hypothetical protein VN21_03640 [Paraclostridium benzoelyticum]MCU9813895.1 DUF3785 domain-containing protein [Paraclostridium sp. AKS73]OXX83016.1 hypothetical protein AVM15_13875 [Paraclostridium benzoelyticum]